jgi:hypothetical protein
VLSTLTGRPFDETQCLDTYWFDILKHSNFYSGVELLISQGMHTFIEIGPGDVLIQRISSWASDLSRKGHCVKLNWHAGISYSEENVAKLNRMSAIARPLFESVKYQIRILPHRILQFKSEGVIASETYYYGWMHEEIFSAWFGHCTYHGCNAVLPSVLLEILLSAALKENSDLDFVCVKNVSFTDPLNVLEFKAKQLAQLSVVVGFDGETKICIRTQSKSKLVTLGMAILNSGLASGHEAVWIETEMEHQLVFSSCRSMTAIDLDNALACFKEAGISYSEAYQSIKSCFCNHHNQNVTIFVMLCLSDIVTVHEGHAGYLIHPTMLEGVYQAAFIACSILEGKKLFRMYRTKSIADVYFKVQADSDMRFEHVLTACVKATKIHGDFVISASLADHNRKQFLIIQDMLMTEQEM